MADQLTGDAPHPQIARYVDYFLTELVAQLGSRVAGGLSGLANLKVLAGAYVASAEGATVTHSGVTVPQTHTLRVGKQTVRRSGDHGFDASGVHLTAGQFTEQDLIYLNELGDAVADPEPTLARILANVEDGPAWATAIAGAPNRQALFGRPAAEIDTVPPGAPSSDVNALRALLFRHFTYDTAGAYYAKWGGQGQTFPADLAPAYVQASLREVVLLAGEVYCLGVVPERLYAPDAPETAMREFLVRIERVEADTATSEGTTVGAAPADALSLVPVYSIVRDPRAEGVPPFHQFVFFHTVAGDGVLIPDSAGATLMPNLSALLATAPHPAQIEAYRQSTPDPEYFFDGSGPSLKIRLLGTIKEGATLANLPAGVEAFDIVGGQPDPSEGAPAQTNVRYFLSPIERVVDLAAHPDIEELHEVKAVHPSLSTVHTDLDTAGLRGKIAGPLFLGDGAGVLVGIIDTGIDGSHPAFAGRIHAVWDQSLPTQNPPNIPGLHFGRVLTGADIATTSVDTEGHGTHVAGIAAGAAAPPNYTEPGIASKATIAMVRLRDFGDANILAGARWLFQQAGALNVPCVVNMSLGGHFDDHDGTDPLPIALRALVRDAAGNFRPRRLLVAAAGNERGMGMHVQQDPLPIPTRTPDEVAHPATFDRAAHPEAMATFEIFVRPGTVGTFNFNFFGTPKDPAVNRCNLAIRVELSGGAGGWPGFRRQQPNNNFQFHRIADTRVGISNGRAAGLGVRQSRPVVRLASRQPGRPIDSGVWRVQIFNDGPSEIEVHGYCPQAEGRLVFFRGASERCLIGSPANGEGIISVGSTVNRTSWTRKDGTVVKNERATRDNTGTVTGARAEVKPGLSGFSVSGPVRRVNRPLDAVAPGGALFSAKSAQISGVAPNNLINDFTVVFSGTSMACPVVTGLAACVMERFPDTNYPDFQARLRAASTLPAGGTADDFGPGIISAGKLV
jgi:subtilisin family serine protease